MKSKKMGKGKPAAKRRSKDLAPKTTNDAKGGSKKSLIGNFPR
jgi:hypothetical protein